MTNLEKYNQVFMEHFEISAEELPGLKYRSYAKWDSMAIWSYVLFLKKHLTLPWKRLIFLLFLLMRRAWRS